MAEIGRWGGHKFEMTPEVVRGFTGLTIKASSETQDKTSSSQKYVARKNGNPTEVSLTAHLNAFLGCDVRAEAMAFVSEASAGKKDYFYVGNAKLVTCQLMLTDASVEEVQISGGNIWTRADVKLTMKQCSKNDGSTSGGSSSGGSKKASTKTSSAKTTTKTTTTAKTTTTKASATTAVKAVVSAIGTVVSKVSSAVSSAKSYITSTVKKVQSVSTTAKKSSATKKAATTSTSAKLLMK